ncbi:nucleotide disphospho-sugar-binding domain-containing protein [Aporhodopirellula aestuarii]|uniref:Glycosyltransferase n=1 Tax=Aporhodopirellula aestuarii TaxID=2950107 RepID=A0ABT0U5G6_9BACT|nr:nucleotide disphospho-sugar-binding domain-containing protein [Aporhodopirellula aestuarii]MCM2372163.1 glycosyltransferase [Aporhodopirellula aestuarii]
MSDSQANRDRPLAILSAPGSRGDVNPMVAIARELDRRGFECHVSVAEPYAGLVEAFGLHAHVLIDSESFHQVVSQSRFWRPWTGARRVLTEVAERFFHPHLKIIDQLYRPGRSVLVAHPLDFASRVFRETTPGCRLSSVHLAPAMLRHVETPPRLLPEHGLGRAMLPKGWSRWNRLTYFLADHVFLDRAIGAPLNAERRRRAGLRPQRRIMERWWCSPDQVLGLYPSWYAPEIYEKYSSGDGLAAPLECLGFPLDDGIVDRGSSDADVSEDRVAGKHDGGGSSLQGEELPAGRPLLVTTGSAHHGDESFVSRVAEICELRSVPVVWCCPSNPGGIVYRNVRCVGYVPLGEWLPRCRGIIHHGGIGTTSRAIDAKVPQIVRPMAFDQFDNAERVERFGLGVWLRRDRDLTPAIAKLISMSESPLNVPDDVPRGSSVSAAQRAAKRIASLLDHEPFAAD